MNILTIFLFSIAKMSFCRSEKYLKGIVLHMIGCEHSRRSSLFRLYYPIQVLQALEIRPTCDRKRDNLQYKTARYTSMNNRPGHTFSFLHPLNVRRCFNIKGAHQIRIDARFFPPVLPRRGVTRLAPLSLSTTLPLSFASAHVTIYFPP